MRLCRFSHDRRPQVGLYQDQAIIPLAAAAEAFAAANGERAIGFDSHDLLDYLPPDGRHFAAAAAIAAWLADDHGAAQGVPRLVHASVELLVPIPRPNKLFLLSGNYRAHVAEGGGRAAERAETFPYLFTKPPSTTLTDPHKPVVIPRTSPDHIDWEIELCVIMGRRARHCGEAEALGHVAGYTVANDISDRRFRPNPQRQERPNDGWFDWAHGKWHDTFFPCGPCVASADALPDPQRLALKLSVNGQLKQDANTAQQIFPVAAVVSFISGIVTLEPGDLISTGTAAGVGYASGTYLKPGDRMEAWIEGIGTLVTPVVGED
jgi:2-keto-4-pentenoate hydratase/2-oxohepta-3-ene-1,7-dioic acid hydratase in catechol pathway